MREFQPLVRNPHLLTIAGHFWPRSLDTVRFPVSSQLFETEPGVKVLVKTQRPPAHHRGRMVLVHGLESSADAGYMLSMAQAGLEAGYTVHRFQLRGCGDDQRLSSTMYHGGLTVDLLCFLRSLGEPAFLVGYSLGGNLALKLAGELGTGAAGLIAGVCAISTPIDLAACGRRLAERANWIYERRFVRKLARKLAASGLVPNADLSRRRSLWEFDDEFTARLWGFGTAGNYYATQSSNRFLGRISVPTLLVQAKDDPIIPFEVFHHPALSANPNLELVAPDHGGHLGFISRQPPWFWNDEVVLDWVRQREQKALYTRHSLR